MGNKREKNPTFTYIKEFDNFPNGYEELIKIIPELEVYGGIVPAYDNVVTHMTKVINENIPSPHNELYPNTLSFSISAKEVGFLTDDSLAFGWKIFINRKDGTLSYQFRVTFISLSMSKRKYIERLISNKWKARDLVEKQSRFWHEATNSQSATIKNGSPYGRVQNSVSKTNDNNHDILVEDGRDRATTHNNGVDSRQDNSNETSKLVVKPEKEKVEEVKEKSKLPPIISTERHNPEYKFDQVQEEPKLVAIKYDPDDYIRKMTKEEILESTKSAEDNEASKPMTREEYFESTKPEVAELPKFDPKSKIEPRFINEKKESAKVVEKKVAKPTQAVSLSSGEIEKNIEMEKLRTRANCSISKGDTEAQFNITHKGVHRYININDHHDDILLNRAAYTLMIENVVYNYKTFEVTVLDEPYQPESATNLGCRSDHVNITLPDTAFVGDAAKRKFLEERGMNSSSEVIIAGKTTPKAKKTLVLDKTPKVQPAKYTPAPVKQMIIVNNVGGPNL